MKRLPLSSSILSLAFIFVNIVFFPLEYATISRLFFTSIPQSVPLEAFWQGGPTGIHVVNVCVYVASPTYFSMKEKMRSWLRLLSTQKKASLSISCITRHDDLSLWRSSLWPKIHFSYINIGVEYRDSHMWPLRKTRVFPHYRKDQPMFSSNAQSLDFEVREGPSK